MELQREICRMFLVGFDGKEITPGLRSLLARGVAGVILFGRNVESPAQLAELCGRIKEAAGRPVLICIDQEGGRVRRLRQGFTAVPSMRAVGRTGDATLAYEVGRILARELRAVNIDVNFAPSLDVDSNPANPVIGDRSFGPAADLVGRLGASLIRGMQAEGVAGCGKHFPGHGDTAQDSHLELPRLPHAMERLRRVELLPFKAAVEAGVAMIMTSHVVFHALDPHYPATMSEAVIGGILRQEMGFEGVVVSDDLEMEAIAANYPVEDVVLCGALAGVDLFSVCHDEALQHRTIDALAAAVERGAVSAERVLQANRRIHGVMKRFCRPAAPFDEGLIDTDSHRRVVERINGRTGENEADPTDR